MHELVKFSSAYQQLLIVSLLSAAICNQLVASAKVTTTTTTTKANTWQDAIDILFVSAHGGSPLEPEEVSRLLNLAHGAKVGPFDVDSLLQLCNEASYDNCNEQTFGKFDEAFKLANSYANTITLYLRQCFKKQIKACKYELKFMSNLAKFNREEIRDIERAADLVQEAEAASNTHLKLDTKSCKSEQNYDLDTIARAVKIIAGHRNVSDGERELADKYKLRKNLLDTVDKLKSQCDIVRTKLEADLTGLLRDPEACDDHIVLRWNKAMQLCYALENESDQISDRIHVMLLNDENDKNCLLNSIRSLLRL